MIISRIQGRIGNAMFMIAIGLYLSKKTGYDFAIIHKPKENSHRKNYYTDYIYPYEFFKSLNILDTDYDISSYKNITGLKYASLNDFPLEDNIVINDWFINKSYINYETVKDIYVPSKQLKEEIFDLYNPTRETLAINVRRGDFLWKYNTDRGYHTQSEKWYNAAYKYLNKNYDKILINSDDILWCKQNLLFHDNIIFVDKSTENPKIFFDLFLPTFTGDNIISASTFSWWGAYLNENPNKTVIMPYPWNEMKPETYGNKFYLNNTIKFHNSLCKNIS